jgi:hypothetical protein
MSCHRSACAGSRVRRLSSRSCSSIAAACRLEGDGRGRSSSSLINRSIDCRSFFFNKPGPPPPPPPPPPPSGDGAASLLLSRWILRPTGSPDDVTENRTASHRLDTAVAARAYSTSARTTPALLSLSPSDSSDPPRHLGAGWGSRRNTSSPLFGYHDSPGRLGSGGGLRPAPPAGWSRMVAIADVDFDIMRAGDFVPPPEPQEGSPSSPPTPSG